MGMQIEEGGRTAQAPSSLATSVPSSSFACDLSPSEMHQLQSSLGSWLSQSSEGKKILGFHRKSGKGEDVNQVAQTLAPLYLPVFAWIDRLLRGRLGDNYENSRRAEGGTRGDAEHGGVKKQKNNNEGGALVVGISAPQGSGKSSLVDALKWMFQQNGVEGVVTLSLDDFYVLHEKQEKLAKKHSENPLLQRRGNPGTHEPTLAACVLSALKNPSHGDVQMPVFDKSLNGGQGDRLCVKDWKRENSANVKLVLFEGWMLGFRAVKDASAEYMPALTEEEIKWMEPVNKALKDYEPVNSLVDAWVVMQTSDLTHVYGWRKQQEQALRATEGDGMTEDQVHEFVDMFMPVYKAYLGGFRQPSLGCGTSPILDISLGPQREVQSISLRQDCVTSG